jgi:hypothetical protein
MKRFLLMAAMLLTMSPLMSVSAQAGTDLNTRQAQATSGDSATIKAFLASPGEVAYRQEMQREAAYCGCNPPCRNTVTNRGPDITSNGLNYVYAHVWIVGTGYYPACTFQYKVYFDAGGHIFDAGKASARWWVCGTQQTTEVGNDGGNTNQIYVWTPVTKYGSCGPQVDNLGSWWAIGGDVETVSTTSDDQYINENT